MRMTLIVVAAFCLQSGCTPEESLHARRSALQAAPPEILPRRSLAVTEAAILARFGFGRVMDQLVAQSGVPGLTARDLFQQWWDTQNPGPGLGRGPHCDDTVDASGTPLLNDFPYSCRLEGLLAAVDPFVDPENNPEAYLPIGLSNRFDLAPADGSHCGEHRIVYARRAGIANLRQRNLVIIEAIMPNPHPQQGLKGCRKLAEHWAKLSALDDLEERADELEALYFAGIPGFPPVIHVDHLGQLGPGQVRTNQFIQEGVDPGAWSLREFKLRRTCAADGSCSELRFVPVTDKLNPFGPLFAPGLHARADAFQTAFVAQTAALAADTLAEIDLEVDDAFDTGQSQASGSDENRYLVQFGIAPSPLRAALEAELARLALPLLPEDLVARAQALSCAGCHRHSNGQPLGGGLVWPSSLGFTHVTERETEIVDGSVAFRISPALVSAFLPKRKQVLEDYLADKLKKPARPTDPIGKRRTH